MVIRIIARVSFIVLGALQITGLTLFCAFGIYLAVIAYKHEAPISLMERKTPPAEVFGLGPDDNAQNKTYKILWPRISKAILYVAWAMIISGICYALGWNIQNSF